MARIEIDGIYKHAPLSDAQITSPTKRNLNRELIIKRDAIGDRSDINGTVMNPATNANAYPTNYIMVFNYDSTDSDGNYQTPGNNPNIRRHIPTLELLGNTETDRAGSAWINIQATPASGSYNYIQSGSTIQNAFELLDTTLAENTLKYLIDSTTVGSLVSSTDGNTSTSTTSNGMYQIALGHAQSIDSSSYSTISGGQSNHIIGASHCAISGGGDNYIIDSYYGSIAGGGKNYIYNSHESGIVSGWTNYIIASLYSFIGAGNSNYIRGSSDYSTIVSGQTCYIDNSSDNSSILSAYNSYIDYASTSIICAGWSTSISGDSDQASYNSFIGVGASTYINKSYRSFIGNGQDSYIKGGSYNSFMGNVVASYIDGASFKSAIVASHGSYIKTNSTYAFVGGGSDNYITSCSYSFIGGGATNYITNGERSTIVGGTGNGISGVGTGYSFIGGGSSNYVSCTNASNASSVIGGGYHNYITGHGIYGVVCGGYYNYITTSTNASYIYEGNFIGGGKSNKINGYVTSSAIASGVGNYIYSTSTTSSNGYNFIGGGNINYIYTASYSSIGGGISNVAAGSYAFIGGGNANSIDGSSTYVFIGGGSSNVLFGGCSYSGITSGLGNYIYGGASYSIVGGGTLNYIINGCSYAVISGGNNNYIQSASSNSFIGGGYKNYIESGSGLVICGGNNNYILSGTLYSVIGGGNNNYINISSSHSVIAGGYNNYIQINATYSTISGGQHNYIECTNSFVGAGNYLRVLNASNYSGIVSGANNYITGSPYAFIGAGSVNYIQDSTNSFIISGAANLVYDSAYSGILGGNENILSGSANSFIIGTDIDTTSYARTNMTYMNNVFLWDCGVELKDKTASQDNVLMVESVSGNVATVKWGTNLSALNAYSGNDPLGTRAGTYIVKSRGSSIFIDNYINVLSSETSLPNTGHNKVIIGTNFTSEGYRFSYTSASDYNDIVGNAGIVASNGLEILDGFTYTITPIHITLEYRSPYLKQPAHMSYSYSNTCYVTRNGSTRTMSFANHTVNVDSTFILDDYSRTRNGYSSTYTLDTSNPSLSVVYNTTTNKINFAIRDTFSHHRFVYKFNTTYSCTAGTAYVISWPAEFYALPSVGDTINFWTSDPSGASGTMYTVASIDYTAQTVTLNITGSGTITNAACWVYVPNDNRLPSIQAIIEYQIIKVAV